MSSLRGCQRSTGRESERAHQQPFADKIDALCVASSGEFKHLFDVLVDGIGLELSAGNYSIDRIRLARLLVTPPKQQVIYGFIEREFEPKRVGSRERFTKARVARVSERARRRSMGTSESPRRRRSVTWRNDRCAALHTRRPAASPSARCPLRQRRVDLVDGRGFGDRCPRGGPGAAEAQAAPAA